MTMQIGTRLSMSVARNERHICVTLDGSIDANSGRSLWSSLARTRLDYHARYIVLDMWEVPGLSRAGLAWLVRSVADCAKANGKMLLARPDGKVERLLCDAEVPYKVRLPSPTWPRAWFRHLADEREACNYNVACGPK